MATGASAAQVKALYEGIAYEEVPLDGMRATIAKRLVEAKQTIPHFYLTADMDVGRLIAMREEANAAAPKSAGRPARLQAFAQRFHHQGLGGGAAAHSRRQCGVGRRPHLALYAFRHWHCGGDRRRPDHAGGPQRRTKIAHRDFGGNARPRRTRPRQEAQAERLPRRRQRDLEFGHVRRARILGHHQSAARHHPGGGRNAPRSQSKRRTAG